MLLEQAISDALQTGNALCKFISRNEVGSTGGHQYGFYLPKSAWRMFMAQPPEKNKNFKSAVKIKWPENLITESSITWYGIGTRSEHRLTKFGKNFPWLDESLVGSLLVLIPFTLTQFNAFVLQSDEEIETFLSTLGIDTLGGWGVFSKGKAQTETEDECLNRVYESAIQKLEDFPTGKLLAMRAREAVKVCLKNIDSFPPDDKIIKWISSEYQLFRKLEDKVSLPIIQQNFENVEAFISVAATVMNRRKSRAGHSFEYHVEQLLIDAGLPFDRQPSIDGRVKPDLLFPGKKEYEDSSFPVSKLLVAGLKTTCKDRWRQILNEGKRIPEKHLITLQEGISKNQLIEMREANVTLVVPKKFHKGYDTNTGIRLLSMEGFLNKIKALTKTGIKSSNP